MIKIVNEKYFYIVGIKSDGSKLYYNEVSKEWVDNIDDSTHYDDGMYARNVWFNLDKNDFKKVFIPYLESSDFMNGKDRKQYRGHQIRKMKDGSYSVYFKWDGIGPWEEDMSDIPTPEEAKAFIDSKLDDDFESCDIGSMVNESGDTDKFVITSHDYELSHGKMPRGNGHWAFKFYPLKNKEDDFGDIEFFSGTLTQAKKQAKEYGIKNGYIKADVQG